MGTEKKAAAEVQENQPEQTVAQVQVPVAYCGPTIKGVAPQYTVFVDGIPEKLAEIAEEHPVVKALIVPREKLAEMRVKVEQNGTRENLLYQNAVSVL